LEKDRNFRFWWFLGNCLDVSLRETLIRIYQLLDNYHLFRNDVSIY